jgi:hypothetical protein
MYTRQRPSIFMIDTPISWERMLHKDYDRKGSVATTTKNSGHEPEEAWRQNEPIGGKLPVVKWLCFWLRDSLEPAVRESAICRESIKFAWDGRQPPRTWARKRRNFRRRNQPENCIRIQQVRLPIQTPSIVTQRVTVWRLQSNSAVSPLLFVIVFAKTETLAVSWDEFFCPLSVEFRVIFSRTVPVKQVNRIQNKQ